MRPVLPRADRAPFFGAGPERRGQGNRPELASAAPTTSTTRATTARAATSALGRREPGEGGQDRVVLVGARIARPGWGRVSGRFPETGGHRPGGVSPGAGREVRSAGSDAGPAAAEAIGAGAGARRAAGARCTTRAAGLRDRAEAPLGSGHGSRLLDGRRGVEGERRRERLVPRRAEDAAALGGHEREPVTEELLGVGAHPAGLALDGGLVELLDRDDGVLDERQGIAVAGPRGSLRGQVTANRPR